jgi:hypothetical protein
MTSNDEWCPTDSGGNQLTIFDTFPDTILVWFPKTSHALRVTPPYEVCLLELPHEGLFARFSGGREKKLLCWR